MSQPLVVVTRCHVTGVDMVGHGLSDGPLGLIPDYRILPSDLAALASLVRSKAEFVKLPLFIYCHSLGTLVTILALQSIPNVTAVVFVGTALTPGYASASPFGIKALYPVTKTSFGRGVAFVTSSIDPKGPAGATVTRLQPNFGL
jgi:pimeloyl-ACP methyl ester carboxylesterase